MDTNENLTQSRKAFGATSRLGGGQRISAFTLLPLRLCGFA